MQVRMRRLGERYVPPAVHGQPGEEVDRAKISSRAGSREAAHTIYMDQPSGCPRRPSSGGNEIEESHAGGRSGVGVGVGSRIVSNWFQCWNGRGMRGFL
jgi:hypothetical protein